MFQILFGHFQIFNNFDDFKSNILNKTTFSTNQDESTLESIIKKAIKDQYSPQIIDYLTEKTLTLYHMMENIKCIIIYGSFNSGKSTLLDILNESIKSSTNQTEDKNKFFNLPQLKIFESFYLYDTWLRMYGQMSANDEGPI